MNRTTYGLDIAKNVMQLHWVEIETGEIGRKKARVGHLSKRGDPYLRTLLIRSEERRVGKECRSRWSPYH